MLDVGDRLRHARLREIEASSGLCHAALIDDREEQAQVAKLQPIDDAIMQIHDVTPHDSSSCRYHKIELPGMSNLAMLVLIRGDRRRSREDRREP
jgi:hypothetical protein